MAQNNYLTLNLTLSICFSMRRKAKDKLIIKIYQEDTKEVIDFKFLGVILDSQLNFFNTLKRCARR